MTRGETDRRRTAIRILGAALVAGSTLLLARPALTARYPKAPEFPSREPREWIGPPQSIKALAGQVVLLDVWTFG